MWNIRNIDGVLSKCELAIAQFQKQPYCYTSSKQFKTMEISNNNTIQICTQTFVIS